jgi:hypothetical protein
MTRRTIIQMSLLLAVSLATMVAGAVFEFGSAVSDKQASAAELEQFRSTIRAFLGGAAARRGAAAAERVTGDVLEVYARSRDLALYALLETIDRDPGEALVPTAFRLRVLFTADELEKFSPKDVFAALVAKGEVIAPEGAAAWVRAPLVSAEFENGSPRRVHVADEKGRQISLEQQPSGAWLLDRAAVAILALDSWYRLTPACAGPEVDAARCAAEQKEREASFERWRRAPNTAEIGSRPRLERNYGALYFTDSVHHPFDPKYLNPLR